MKRLGRRELVLFGVPFVLLGATALWSGSGLKLDTNETVFTRELKHQIPVGTPVAQAVQLLQSNGFSQGAIHRDYSGAKPDELGFSKSRIAFPEIRDRHLWAVWLTIRNNRVQKVDGLFTYEGHAIAIP